MNENRAKRNRLLGERIIKGLVSRNMEGYYAETKEAALAKALEWIPEGSSISWGGSVSVNEIGLKQAVCEGNYKTYNREAAKTPEEQAAVSQQMMALYRDNNISLTGGIGCLPLLIQLPIFAALYAAIRYSPDLYHATFFGIPLGKPSIILAVLSFIAYAAQSYLGLVGVPEAQKKQMKAAIWMSPFMTFFISITSSAGLGLYFFIGGLFAILQTLMVNAYRPRIRRQIEEESKKNPIKMPEAPVINTPSSSTKPTDAIDQLRKGDAKPSDQANRNRQRNAGKQQHHKK